MASKLAIPTCFWRLLKEGCLPGIKVNEFWFGLADLFALSATQCCRADQQMCQMFSMQHLMCDKWGMNLLRKRDRFNLDAIHQTISTSTASLLTPIHPYLTWLRNWVSQQGAKLQSSSSWHRLRQTLQSEWCILEQHPGMISRIASFRLSAFSGVGQRVNKNLRHEVGLIPQKVVSSLVSQLFCQLAVMRALTVADLFVFFFVYLFPWVGACVCVCVCVWVFSQQPLCCVCPKKWVVPVSTHPRSLQTKTKHRCGKMQCFS